VAIVEIKAYNPEYRFIAAAMVVQNTFVYPIDAANKNLKEAVST
jgi:hypothetical protein